VHNSGHFTLGACATSQFEQHVRAICSLPLGPTTLWRPAVMLNLLGDAWAHGEPDWAALLRQFPQAQLHLYGKSTPRPGRKMGHLLLLADDEDAVLQLADRVEGELDRLTASSGLPCTWTAAPTVSGRSQAPTEAA
jgi:5-(carboxyamino)imidazole ribonucleotide synthase